MKQNTTNEQQARTESYLPASAFSLEPWVSAQRTLRGVGLLQVVCICLVLAGIFLRISTIDRLPLWTDEAESSINALTILQHGVPKSTYLGAPIFENTLLVPWPENPEYRYKDLSYSDRGVAIYHGWLPLYAIAASLWTAGVHPDEINPAKKLPLNVQERHIRTVAPRIPAVIFGTITLILFYIAGKALYGIEAGLAALAIGALSPVHIATSQQSRYFAATIALSAACGLSTWYMVQRRRWTDCALGGVAFGLLFHTHILTFIIANVMLALTILTLRFRQGYPWAKLVLFGSIMTAMVAPWIITTDFLHAAAAVPPAWPLMHLPNDLFIPELFFSGYGIALLAICAVLAGSAITYYPSTAARKLRSAIVNNAHALFFLYAWLLVSYLAFVLLIPAVSFSLTRFGVILLAPATLLIALVLAAAAKAVLPRHRMVLALLFGVTFAVGSNHLWPKVSDAQAELQYKGLEAGISFIAKLPSRPTRIYANPNDHLVLTYYSGVSVQSIAAVREEFLNRYEGDIVFLEKGDFGVSSDDPIAAPHLKMAAERRGVTLSDADAERLSRDVATYSSRVVLASKVASVQPPPEPLPQFVSEAYQQWREVCEGRAQSLAARCRRNPIFNGFKIRSVFDWTTVFFFRFANLEAERLRPNYSSRLQNAIVTPLNGAEWLAYYSPGRLNRSTPGPGKPE